MNNLDEGPDDFRPRKRIEVPSKIFIVETKNSTYHFGDIENDGGRMVFCNNPLDFTRCRITYLALGQSMELDCLDGPHPRWFTTRVKKIRKETWDEKLERLPRDQIPKFVLVAEAIAIKENKTIQQTLDEYGEKIEKKMLNGDVCLSIGDFYDEDFRKKVLHVVNCDFCIIVMGLIDSHEKKSQTDEI